MRGRTLLLTLAVAVSLPSVSLATLIVDPPRPITHRVTVQMIETALDNGTSPATVFGDAMQRADIEAAIDAIWAQAGIDINLLSPVVRYNDTFAYQGNLPTDQVRPINDLSAMYADASFEGGILHPDPSVINTFFVKIAPGWEIKGSNWVTGIGNIGTNGIAEYIGETQLTSEAGRDNVAHWVAHEIGHNLGLFHTGGGTQNLMNGNSKTTSQLTDVQISAIFQTQYRYDSVAYIPAGGTGFPQLPPVFLDGDYNRDGKIDSADFTFWRDTLGSTTNLLADGNGNGVVDAADYTVWKAHFGFFMGSGQVSLQSTPEPATVVYLAAALAGLISYRRPRLRRSRFPA